ncbi:MAG: hypothetical protein QOE33_2261 [Acidobacteriota bacterium]|nr:hypothetical protein [Acidobacteriota bacterium]
MRCRFALALALSFVALCARAHQVEAQTPAQHTSPSQATQPTQKPMTTTPQTPATTAATQMPAANPADVDTLDHIVAALYDVISGPAEKKRDWDRLRSLFAGGARMIPTVPLRATGTPPDAPLTGSEAYAPRVLSVDDYVARAAPRMSSEGFFEREAARRTEQFGHIAHVFSTYESRHASDDAKPFQRGINSIQLMNDGKRWWIVTIFWEGETDRTPLPEKYLKSAP